MHFREIQIKPDLFLRSFSSVFLYILIKGYIMKYENKVLILKETSDGFSTGSPVGGILRLETENGVSTVFLSLINVKALKNGTYFLFLSDGKDFFYTKDLGKRPTSARERIERTIPCERVFSGLIFLDGELPTTVAFSSGEENAVTVTEFKKTVAEYYYKEFKERKKTFSRPKEYDDEAVATENYYDYDDKISEKIREITERENERINDENGGKYREEQGEKEKEEGAAFGIYNETHTDLGKTERYYLKVKAELEKTLSSYPRERILENIFRGSRWAKIAYSDSRYYVVGVIKENGVEKYICYGVPERFSEYAPKELDGYCSFIPLSVFDLSGNGYWMMFQDADTGECLKR